MNWYFLNNVSLQEAICGGKIYFHIMLWAYSTESECWGFKSEFSVTKHYYSNMRKFYLHVANTYNSDLQMHLCTTNHDIKYKQKDEDTC